MSLIQCNVNISKTKIYQNLNIHYKAILSTNKNIQHQPRKYKFEFNIYRPSR